MGQINYKETVQELKSKMENWGKRSHNILGRSFLINIYAMPKIMYKMRDIEIPKETQKKMQSLIFNFLWKGKTQTVSQQNISKPRYLGGTGLFDMMTQRQVIWTQELVNIINKPNTEENLLKRSILGPSPRLTVKIKQKTQVLIHTNYNEINSAKIKFMKKILQGDITDETNLKKIYNLQENNTDLADTKLNQFLHLSKIANPQLWFYGFLTQHRGHMTRSWLHQRKSPENQDHIIESCTRTKPLRDHIRKNYNIPNFSDLTPDHKTNKIILAYQKVIFPYIIHLNKGGRHKETVVEKYEQLLLDLEMIAA